MKVILFNLFFLSLTSFGAGIVSDSAEERVFLWAHSQVEAVEKRDSGVCFYSYRTSDIDLTLVSHKGNNGSAVNLRNDSGLKILCGEGFETALKPINKYYISRKRVIDNLNSLVDVMEKKRMASSMIMPAEQLVMAGVAKLHENRMKKKFSDPADLELQKHRAAPWFFLIDFFVDAAVGYQYEWRMEFDKMEAPGAVTYLTDPNGTLYNNKNEDQLAYEAASYLLVDFAEKAVVKSAREQEQEATSNLAPCPSAAEIPACKAFYESPLDVTEEVRFDVPY